MKLRILLLCDDRPSHAGTLLDHIGALSSDSRHAVFKLNPRGWPYDRCIDFDFFDVVIIHYSIAIIYETYLPEVFRAKLKLFQGLKVLFIQDEYRQVSTYVDAMLDLNVDLVFTSVPESSIPAVYDRLLMSGVRLFPTLTGYADRKLAAMPVRPLAERPFDVIYRGRPCPFELGNLAREKVTIAERFNDYAARLRQPGLKCDVDWREEARIYGAGWTEFMSSGRACLGTESGASIVDHDGNLQARVEAYREVHPSATYEEVHEKFLAPYEGNVVINSISPRAFEAISLRTALVLHPGQYSGILKPWVHYIPLLKDFSNFDKVAELLQNVSYLEAMTERAYQDIIRTGKWSNNDFTEEVDGTLESEFDMHWHRRQSHERSQFDFDEWRRSLEQAEAALADSVLKPIVLENTDPSRQGLANGPRPIACPGVGTHRERPLVVRLVLPARFERPLRRLRRIFTGRK